MLRGTARRIARLALLGVGALLAALMAGAASAEVLGETEDETEIGEALVIERSEVDPVSAHSESEQGGTPPQEEQTDSEAAGSETVGSEAAGSEATGSVEAQASPAPIPTPTRIDAGAGGAATPQAPAGPAAGMIAAVLATVLALAARRWALR